MFEDWDRRNDIGGSFKKFHNRYLNRPRNSVRFLLLTNQTGKVARTIPLSLLIPVLFFRSWEQRIILFLSHSYFKNIIISETSRRSTSFYKFPTLPVNKLGGIRGINEMLTSRASSKNSSKPSRSTAMISPYIDSLLEWIDTIQPRLTEFLSHADMPFSQICVPPVLARIISVVTRFTFPGRS